MPEAIVIKAGSRADAACIARELRAFNPELACTRGAWTVDVHDSLKVAEVLSALETCLGDNGIRAVTVTVDGRTYVMEPAA
jgi:hypothetical protein